MKRALLTVFAAVLLISSAFTKPQHLAEKNFVVKTVSGKSVPIVCEVAIKPEELRKGYMERTDLADGKGMLFVFAAPHVLSFWMKNTPTPLSVAYITSEGRIADIYDMKPYDLSSVVSSEKCQYALEVPKGYFERAGIKVGDTLILKE